VTHFAQIAEKVKDAAIECGEFYVHKKWMGGTLTNLTEVRFAHVHKL
jgi:ribosomal protein S2